MKITILTYVDEEGGKELDPVVGQVARVLRKQKHKVSMLAVHGDVRKLVNGLARRKPDLVFNLLEEFGDDPAGNISVTGLLELERYRYTGCGPGEFYLGQDKALAKKLLAFEEILYPRFAVFSRNADFETGGNLRMPLFVKPVAQDASIGIDEKSLVRNATELLERVNAIHDQYEDAALAEEYIEGREFYVGVLGNMDPQALPPLEADFSGMPDGALRVYDRNAKWGPGSEAQRGVKAAVANSPNGNGPAAPRLSCGPRRASSTATRSSRPPKWSSPAAASPAPAWRTSGPRPGWPPARSTTTSQTATSC